MEHLDRTYVVIRLHLDVVELKVADPADPITLPVIREKEMDP